ncbi:MAG: 23S rRNA (adenine(2503)-C(2))-methyltransferase RlmN [Bacteroidaceae bacterium]|nr:23S rRNA (adenine(2503)-C(2))-methyltransferase RlmN [Bacteroidaceae bacterium]
MGRKNLVGMTLAQLQQVAVENGMPLFTARQLADWLYVKQVSSIDSMTNISLKHRAMLAENYEVGLSEPSLNAASDDGTVKFLFPVRNGHFVETVYIPDGDRATLCVSSQVGCKMGCIFCMTGRQQYTASLTAGEILNQILSLPGKETLTNVVFMGMGEPLDNLENVLAVQEILTAPWGFGWSPKRITISTVGLRRELKQLIEGCECHIAVSLHAPTPEKRRELIPAEKAFSMTEMLEVLRRYDFSHQRRLSFEYTMFDGVNDSLDDARQLMEALHGLSCRVNLIRFHAIPDSPLRPVPEGRMTEFRDWLTAHGVFATIRASRGEDIWAACGMLSTSEQEKSGVSVKREEQREPVNPVMAEKVE